MSRDKKKIVEPDIKIHYRFTGENREWAVRELIRDAIFKKSFREVEKEIEQKIENPKKLLEKLENLATYTESPKRKEMTFQAVICYLHMIERGKGELKIAMSIRGKVVEDKSLDIWVTAKKDFVDADKEIISTSYDGTLQILKQHGFERAGTEKQPEKAGKKPKK